MKFCLLATVDPTRLTLANLYIDHLNKIGIVCDAVCVKKQANQKHILGIRNQYEFDATVTKDYTFLRKLIYFYKMIDFFDEINTTEKYDFIIVWNELTAFIFSKYLAKNFENKYSINIRDYQYFRVPLVYRNLNRAIKHSRFSTVSSEKYMEYLPQFDYLVVHSMNIPMLNTIKEDVVKNHTKSNKIRIVSIGQVRWLKNVYALIDSFKNDTRFELIFAGSGSEAVDEYIKGKDINNVKTFGKFNPGEESLYLSQADVIFNLYGTGNKHVDLALSIKFYYAVFFRLPILTYDGTFLNECAQKCGLAVTTRFEQINELPDRLFNFVINMSSKEIDMK